MTANGSAGNSLLVSRDDAAADLGHAVRIFCLADKAWNQKRVAEEAGIDYERMKDLMANDPADRRHATLSEALSIWAVTGTRGASTCLARIGMVAEPEEVEPDCVQMTTAEAARDIGELSVLAVNGIDATEAPAADALADRLIERGVKIKAAAAAAKRKGRAR